MTLCFSLSLLMKAVKCLIHWVRGHAVSRSLSTEFFWILTRSRSGADVTHSAFEYSVVTDIVCLCCCLTSVSVFQALRRSLEVSVRRSTRDSAGEESEEEWIEEQIEREESSESLPDLTLPVQHTSQPINKQLGHGDLIMLEFGPSSQGDDFWQQSVVFLKLCFFVCLYFTVK